VRVISIDSGNDNFCSGFDLSERGKPDIPPRFGATQRRIRVDINRFITTLFECQTPIVAAVRGHAQGLGLAIALAADVAIVADDATLRAPFTSIGMTPDSGLAWLLPRLAGVARAKHMVLLGDPITGAQAEEWGLVLGSVPAADVTATANEIVDRFADAATVAVGLAKNLMYRGLTTELAAHLHNEAVGLEMSSRTEDFKEPRRAKRDNRPINFQGR
jgi:2-(1,2-epoxy-1,2-dihydrophenyl)acetyl-CoA isomerase